LPSPSWWGRRADGPTDCAHWSCDNWDAIAAEVAAAQGISHAMAPGQMYLGVALRERLPKVAALFAAGAISARLASSIVWRTDLTKTPTRCGASMGRWPTTPRPSGRCR
jgi:hypothetical protein